MLEGLEKQASSRPSVRAWELSLIPATQLLPVAPRHTLPCYDPRIWRPVPVPWTSREACPSDTSHQQHEWLSTQPAMSNQLTFELIFQTQLARGFSKSLLTLFCFERCSFCSNGRRSGWPQACVLSEPILHACLMMLSQAFGKLGKNRN